MPKFYWLFFITVALFGSLLVYSIKDKASRMEEGKRLSKVYCSSCHEYTDPSLLPRGTWVKKVLPEMGLRLGIGDKNTVLTRMSLKLFDQLNDLGIYPNERLLSEKEWLSIVSYYQHAAPLKINEAQTNSVSKEKRNFKQVLIYADSLQSPQTTMVRFIPNRNEIWVGNGFRQLKKYNSAGEKKWMFRTPSAVVDALDEEKSVYLSMGNMLPNEDRNGRIYHINDQGANGKLMVDSLHRPVQLVKSDLDQDGIQDMLVLEFGFESGQLRMINGKTGVTSIVSKAPGARNIHIRDVNQDGYPDFYVLFAQSREQVSLFLNLGGKEFREEVVLRFPPVFGSSYLDLADMNKDGKEDFILSFGDNADYSIEKKNFHGVAIYLNRGNNKFIREWFFSTYGATKTVAGDFDGDGDLDMGMIAFFSEIDRGNSFLYFEQVADMSFKAIDFELPQANWLVMDSGDMDGDGDLDLILGNFQLNKENTSSNGNFAMEALMLVNEQKMNLKKNLN